ncbi:hypothetical protein Avbf_13567 [Armadillidium vulgare]|nr:hypothetical protein Avbf_13567 [Armadillidium vulgare]
MSNFKKENHKINALLKKHADEDELLENLRVSEQSSGLIDPEVIEIAQVRSSVDNNPSQSRTSTWSDVGKRWSSKKPTRPVENNSKGNNNSSQGSLRRNSGNNDNDQTGNRSAANNNGSRDS